VGKRFCDVTVETPDGKRHTITVESESVYARRDEVFRPVWSGVPGRSKIAANHQRDHFRSTPDLQGAAEAADGVGQQEGRDLRSITEVSQVAVTGATLLFAI